MSEATVIQPTYDEFVAQFSWDQVLAHFDWPVTEKFNLGHELCDRWAKHPTRADALAMRYETKDGSQGGYTYRQLRDLSNRFAAALTILGIQRGDRIAGLMPKIPAFLPMLLGIWKTGAVYVPIFTAFAAPAVAYRLRDSEARLVITTETYLPVIRESQQLANGLTALEQVLVVADPGQMFEGHTLNFWALLEAATPDFQAVEMQLDDVAVLQYTSGSTGNPKGAMIANTFALALYPYARYALNIREDDVFWGAADPGWAYGGIICLPSPLLLGNTVLWIEAPFTAVHTWQVIERYGVTNFSAAPTAYRALAAAGPELAHASDLTLRVATSAGEPLNPEVITWFKREVGLPIYDCYGLTELLMTVCNYHGFDYRPKPGSMGRPMPGFEMGLIDAEGNEVPPGVVGQIAMRRTAFPYQFKGYWKDPGKTAALLIGEWHVTGDSARRDEDGYFWFEGRNDDLINTSAYRVGPFEIESALLEHPAVVESAVVGLPDAQRGEVIKAFIVLQAGQEGTPELVDELQQIVRQRVGKHAYPRSIEFIQDLPKTASGKIQRYLLRSRSE